MSSIELKEQLGKDKVLNTVEEQARRIKAELDEMKEEEMKTYRLTEKSLEKL